MVDTHALKYLGQRRAASDDAVAGSPWFFAETYLEFQKGLEAILAELEKHQNVVGLLDLSTSPYEEEVARIRGMVEWGKSHLGTTPQPRASIIVSGVTYGSLRYLKAGVLYRAHLVELQKCKFLTGAEFVPRSVVKSFDTRIEQLRNLAEMGKLGGLRPAEVFFELLPSDHEGREPKVQEPKRPAPSSPVILDVPIIDPVLRQRCLPILAALEGAGTAEQLDTIIREMSVILEDRVRELVKFSGKASGADLFSATMAHEPPPIRFSPDKDVQEAAHLFFRGYAGVVRNEVMHRLVSSYTKERVLQLLGMVDYLLFLLSKAEIRDTYTSS